MKNNNCVQCGRELTRSYGNEAWSAPFCDDRSCIAYGLLQTGMMPITNIGHDTVSTTSLKPRKGSKKDFMDEYPLGSLPLSKEQRREVRELIEYLIKEAVNEKV